MKNVCDGIDLYVESIINVENWIIQLQNIPVGIYLGIASVFVLYKFHLKIIDILFTDIIQTNSGCQHTFYK